MRGVAHLVIARTRSVRSNLGSKMDEEIASPRSGLQWLHVLAQFPARHASAKSAAAMGAQPGVDKCDCSMISHELWINCCWMTRRRMNSFATVLHTVWPQ